MSILVDKEARVVVHGGTGVYGAAQVASMRASGTNVVAHVSPGRGGSDLDGIPVFDLVADAVTATGANAGIIYVPASGVRDAIIEHSAAGISVAVVAAELVPAHDALVAANYARMHGTWIVGPNTVGISSPGRCMLGSIPVEFSREGKIGIISRSGTMGLMASRILTNNGCGQSTIACIGGDAVSARLPHEYLNLFLDDGDTEMILYVGEIGGLKEYEMLNTVGAADKPVAAMVVGHGAPRGKRMGHAGALIGEERETAIAKREALREAGATVIESFRDLNAWARSVA